MTIELKGLHFFAYHGLYAEERKTGNEFEIDLSVTYQASEKIISHLNETVNYSQLYNLLKSEMQNSRGLLETFVMEVAEAIHLAFPFVKKVALTITKLQPPIVSFKGTVGVKYLKEY